MKIAHIADIQVKNRNQNLFTPYQLHLHNILKSLEQNKDIEVAVLSGDFFEYATPEESERQLIYEFISKLISIDHIKEIVLINGNHDLEKTNKKKVEKENVLIENENSYEINAIYLLDKLISQLNKSDKIIYCKDSKIYDSRLSADLKYVAYSLEDGMNPDLSEINPDSFNICIYHAMLKEYVEYVNLPIRKDVLESLISIEQFPQNSLILAGDIHEPLHFQGSKGQNFYYPGSTQQHTHSEGDYFKIINGELIHHSQAHSKYINIYDVNLTNKSYKLEKININDYVKYVDLVVTQQEEKSVIEGCNQFVKDFVFGISQTYIKIKLPISMLYLEKKLFELFQNSDFNKESQFKNIKVSFENEKISKTVNKVESEAVQQILNEVIIKDGEQVNLDDLQINKDNIDSLILSDTQISTLFKNVSDLKTESIVKKSLDLDINLENLKNDIQSTFDKQLNSFISESKSRRFTIELENASCNSFMALGENNIPLNLPAITRILATNKMGKTTLFRMIRWAVSGEVFSGMKSNTVMQNNLICFNNKIAEIDDLWVKLKMKVNGTPIILTRSLSRKWKNNTTLEEKQSKLWKNYVSTVNRNITCTINPGTEKEKTITGDSAELSIKKWFGDTIDNILIVNQFTIDSLLKSPANKLNNMVLGFIGVDYLQALEDNLDNVKKEIMITGKPTISKDDIVSTITKLKEEKIEKNKELSTLESTDKTELIQKINKLSEDLDDIKNKMINQGNIPLKIEETEKDIKTTNDLIINFQAKTPKDKIIFTEIKPILNSEKINELTKNNDILNNNYDIKNNELQNINNDISLKSNELNKLFNDLLEKIASKLSDNENNKNEIEILISNFNEKITKINDTINSALYTKLKETELVIFKTEEKIKTNNNTISENDKSLSENICSKCGRPLTKTEEEFEELKNTVTKENEELVKNNKILSDKKSDLLKVKKQIEDDIKKLPNLSDYNYKEEIEILSYDCKLSISEISKLKKEIEDKNTELISLDEKKNTVTILKDSVKEASLLFINIDNDTKFNEFSEKYFSKLTSTIKEQISEYYTFKLRKDVLIKDKETIQENIQKNKDEISLITQKYNKELGNYQISYEKNIKENEEINKYNETVRTHNESLDKNKLKLMELRKFLNDLNIIELPKYEIYQEKENNIKLEYQDYKDKLDSLNEKISECKISLTNLDNSLKSFDDKYNSFLKYKHEQMLYKIYDTLIKNDFKLIIFEYYRTFLNNTLSQLLKNVDFELFWDSESNLYMISNNNGAILYTPVFQLSGMETIFCGLSLIYVMSLLNIKNSLSHIFIDELSGQLSEGRNLSYKSTDYQNLYVDIIHKFEGKSIFVVDHNIKDFNQTNTYEVKKEYDKKGNIISIFNKI